MYIRLFFRRIAWNYLQESRFVFYFYFLPAVNILLTFFYCILGLKSLVSLHRSDDTIDGLTEDEVHIIGSVLDLREKLVVDVMTPMEDVFTVSINAILDKTLVHKILKHGYSRIPIKESENGLNYIGMLLVKNLISYDTDDNLPVSHFPISALPETYPDTSCLDILNFFQEGKSKLYCVTSRVFTTNNS